MTEIAAVAVAALAVIVSALVQAFTLKLTREDLKADRAVARSNVVSQIRADDTQRWIENVKHELADWIDLTYNMEYRTDDPKYREWADQENILWSRLMMALDGDDAEERTLLHAMNVMHEPEYEEQRESMLWIERRDEIIRCARSVFTAKRRALFET